MGAQLKKKLQIYFVELKDIQRESAQEKKQNTEEERKKKKLSTETAETS